MDDGTIDLLMPKLMYIGYNLLFFGMGVWKCWKLGLLPTTSADWMSYLVTPAIAESSGVTTTVFQ